MRNDTTCTLCPRTCGVNRTAGELGACKSLAQMRIARAAPHMWEEPCISGDTGSGTIFFSGCSLGCVYCQNNKISRGAAGEAVTVAELVDIFYKLKDQGVNNINFVTPDHYTASILEAMKEARRQGFDLPFVWNTSGYATLESIKSLNGLVDIYLTDFKYMSAVLAKKYSFAPDYPQVAKLALEEMVRQVGGSATSFDEAGMMKKGVIVRHLLLPGHLPDSKEVVKYLYETYGDHIYISLMNQYTPMKGVEKMCPELGRKVTDADYDDLVDYAIALGVENGFVQEGETASESFIPDFVD